MTAIEEIRLMVDEFFEEVEGFVWHVNEKLDELAAGGGAEPHDYTE